MKIAITGKGGVGKTTVTSLLAQAYQKSGHRVLAVDADPNSTLAACLGFPDPDSIPPVSEMDELIEERTGVKPGTGGAMFKLNPRVDDIPERFAVQHNGISLLRMGTVKKGGAGCYCPENAFLQSLISHLFLSERDVMIVDMEAGVEHLGRATVRGVDWLLIVVEASRQSTDTARRIESMSGDIGLKLVGVVGNQVRDNKDVDYIVKAVAPIPVLGTLPYDDTLRRAEVEGIPPDISLPMVSSGISEVIAKMEQKTGQ